MTPDLITALAYAREMQVGDLIPGEEINPNVLAIHTREDDAAAALYVSQRIIARTRSMARIAKDIGEPLMVPCRVSEVDLLEARAVLEAAIYELPYTHWSYRRRPQGTPVNEETVGQALQLVGGAMSMKRENVA